MNTTLDCMACFVRQALEAARHVSPDPAVHEAILRDVLAWSARHDLAHSPPRMAQLIHRRLRQLTGVDDPYREEKDRFNAVALGLLETLHQDLAQAPDPRWLALRLAICGNVIDLGVTGTLADAEIHQAFQSVMSEPFHGDCEEFFNEVNQAEKILYLADNAGEIVFDRLLIEQLPPGRVTVVVRGAPVLNDATIHDAQLAGLDQVARVMDNGSDAPGTLLEDCSAEFREEFAAADVIIAKGQGNYETLNQVVARLYFLFKVKCPVVAGHVGLPLGTHVLLRSPVAEHGGQR